MGYCMPPMPDLENHVGIERPWRCDKRTLFVTCFTDFELLELLAGLFVSSSSDSLYHIMRLIKAKKLIQEGTFEFENFFEEIPQYAILSHTWEAEEVTFQDTSSPNAQGKIGFAKIRETCRLALEKKLDYTWIDTCCIDKSSSAELTESINSMFRWYQNAEVCYAYLSDLEPTDSTTSNLAKCRWFTRGWTLQELIAPSRVEFVDRKWNFRGSKTEIQDEISEITGVETIALRRDLPLTAFSIAHRMAWAARRQTTRTEDRAYSLLGIFDVNMPLIYGEGSKAFLRLQEEIVKRSNDLTIFAWNPSGSTEYCSVLAPSPACFLGSKDVEPFDLAACNPEFALNNKGLRISGSLWNLPIKYDGVEDESTRSFLQLGTCPSRDNITAGIFLRKVGPGFFFRDGRLPVQTIPKHGIRATHTRTYEFYIAIDPPTTQDRLDLVYLSRINFAVQSDFQIVKAMPEEYWDDAHRLFFASKSNFIQALSMQVEIPDADSRVPVVVICDTMHNPPKCRVFTEEAHERLASSLFQPKNFNEKIRMEDLRWEYPEVSKLAGITAVSRGKKLFKIQAVMKWGIVEKVSTSKEIYSLAFDIQSGPFLKHSMPV